jgi:hypothetical protein
MRPRPRLAAAWPGKCVAGWGSEACPAPDGPASHPRHPGAMIGPSSAPGRARRRCCRAATIARRPSRHRSRYRTNPAAMTGPSSAPGRARRRYCRAATIARRPSRHRSRCRTNPAAMTGPSFARAHARCRRCPAATTRRSAPAVARAAVRPVPRARRSEPLASRTPTTPPPTYHVSSATPPLMTGACRAEPLRIPPYSPVGYALRTLRAAGKLDPAVPNGHFRIQLSHTRTGP